MNNSQSGQHHSHAASYYAAMRQPRALLGSLVGKQEAQVTVVGGGLAGLTAALELSRRGQSVVLLEAERIGWGASGRNGGFVSPGFAENLSAIERRAGAATAKKLYTLSVRGVDYVEETITAAGRADIIGGRGWLHVSRSTKTDKLHAWRDRMARQYGADMAFLDGDRLRSILKTDRYRAAVADDKPFHIDPLAYAELLLHLCLENGVGVFEGTRVNDVGRNGAGYVLNTRSGQVQSPKVVVATSAYGGPIRRIERSILPVATYVVASSPGDQRLADVIGFRGCISDQRRAGDYYRLVEDEKGLRLLWGGRITTRRSEPGRLAQMLLKDIGYVYPQLDGLGIEYSWSGLMGYARHKMPLIGEITPGLFSLTGFGGHGLNTTAAGGLAIADALDGEPGTLKLFDSYRAVWGGGMLGRLATQLEYARLRLIDAMDEM